MQKTKIEWTDFSWNPIRGLCPVGCWYCYGKAIYNRFEWMQEGMGEIGYLAEWELEQPIKRKKPTKIFVCSTYELFHSSDKSARDEIFKVIEKCPQHTFQILTKFPQNIDRPMPDNVWLGVSITKPIEMYPRIKSLYQAKAKLKFVSFEPLLGDVGQFRFQGYLGGKVDWIIVGKLTRHGHEYDPKQFWIDSIINHAKKFATPVFLKTNLKEIWGEPLIQEYPNIAEESIYQQNINS